MCGGKGPTRLGRKEGEAQEGQAGLKKAREREERRGQVLSKQRRRGPVSCGVPTSVGIVSIWRGFPFLSPRSLPSQPRLLCLSWRVCPFPSSLFSVKPSDFSGVPSHAGVYLVSGVSVSPPKVYRPPPTLSPSPLSRSPLHN